MKGKGIVTRDLLHCNFGLDGEGGGQLRELNKEGRGLGLGLGLSFAQG